MKSFFCAMALLLSVPAFAGNEFHCDGWVSGTTVPVLNYFLVIPASISVYDVPYDLSVYSDYGTVEFGCVFERMSRDHGMIRAIGYNSFEGASNGKCGLTFDTVKLKGKYYSGHFKARMVSCKLRDA